MKVDTINFKFRLCQECNFRKQKQFRHRYLGKYVCSQFPIMNQFFNKKITKPKKFKN